VITGVLDGQARSRQVRATVRASNQRQSSIHTGQSRYGKGAGNADMFPRILCLARERRLPLRGTGGGYGAAASWLLVPGPWRVLHAAVGQASAYAAVAVVAAVAVLVAVGALRQMLVRRQLSRRVTYDLLPSTSFDPSPEDVARFAHQLARTRPAVAWLRGRYSGIRATPRSSSTTPTRTYRTVSCPPRTVHRGGPADPGGWVTVRAARVLPQQVSHFIRTSRGDSCHEPDRAGRGEGEAVMTLKALLHGNAAPELREVTGRGEESPPAVLRKEKTCVVRAELVLAADAVRPLRAVPLRPDLLQSFAAAVMEVRPGLGERAEICIDLVLVTAARAAHLRRTRIRAGGPGGGWLAGLIHAGLDLLLELTGDILPGKGPWTSSRAGTDAGPRPAAAAVQAAGKLADPSVPLFQAQVLAAAESEVPGRAQAHLHQILAAFDVMRGENWWKTAGVNLGVAHVGADSVWFRRGFDRRLRTGEFAPRRASLVTAAEIAGLLKPPTRHCAHHNVARSGGMVPAPPRNLPVWTGQRDVLPIGYAAGPDGRERLLGMPLDDLFFSLRVGKSRYGKTETALVQAVALALSGRDGVWFLDPHADGWQRARPLLTDPQVLARLWEIDLTVRGDDAKIAGYNPLDMTGQSAEHIEDRVDAVVTAISSALSWGDTPPRQDDPDQVLRDAVPPGAAAAARLRADPVPGPHPA
jgi:hypothetical protein